MILLRKKYDLVSSDTDACRLYRRFDAAVPISMNGYSFTYGARLWPVILDVAI